MKRNYVAAGAALVVLMLMAWEGGVAGAFHPGTPEVRLEGRLNSPWISTEGGTVYLHLLVQAQEIGVPSRRPMNLSLVIDRSGSMGREGKIEHARAAVRSLIDMLRSDDILSIVIYDDVVEVLRPAARVGDKAVLRRLVDEISPRGWTNLGGGMTEGFSQVERNLSRGLANRVILVSDGLANRGITDSYELTRIARRYRSRAVSLSAVGVGLEYNENLMVSLADGGGGNYYYLEHAHNLASTFRKEFDQMVAIVAQNASIDLTLGNGVYLRDAVGCESSREGNRVSIALGDLASGESRELTLELVVPAGRGSRTVASGRVRYATEGSATRTSALAKVTVHYTPDLAEVDRNRDWDAQARADVAVSTRKVEEALKALDEGKKDRAQAILKEAESSIAASPAAARGGAAAAIVKEQETKLRSYTDTLVSQDGNVTRAKKSIQYENYKVQRQR